MTELGRISFISDKLLIGPVVYSESSRGKWVGSEVNGCGGMC